MIALCCSCLKLVENFAESQLLLRKFVSMYWLASIVVQGRKVVRLDKVISLLCLVLFLYL